MNHESTNYYEILCISTEASDDEIRRAYLNMAKKIHPDFNNSANGHEMAELNRIYGVLSNPVTRREYNQRFVPVKALDFTKVPVDVKSTDHKKRPQYRPITPNADSHRLRLVLEILLLICLLCAGAYFAINILNTYMELPAWLARLWIK